MSSLKYPPVVLAAMLDPDSALLPKMDFNSVNEFKDKLRSELRQNVFENVNNDVNTIFNSFLNTYLQIFYFCFPKKNS